jgi:hypothetical protein
MTRVRDWLAGVMVRLAARRMRRSHPDWAQAMMSEHANLCGQIDQLDWAFGSLRASLALGNGGYPAVLALGVVAMALYQWSADESLVTLCLMAALSLLLGFLQPSRFLVSGVAVGVVVALVNGFETLSGLRPAYEIHQHSWTHDLRWLVLIAPALASSALGRQAGLRLLPRVFP